jgi:predicted dienelactone hydrolase
VAGVDDDNVPVESSAKYLAKQIRGAKLDLLPGGVRHYEFLGTCTALGRERLSNICTDKPGVARDAVHEKVAGMAVEFFDQRLGKGGQ